MKSECTKWQDQLFEAALTEKMEGGLAQHLLHCAECAKELSALRARRQQLDALLPLVAQDAEPSAEFRGRVLAAAEAANDARRARPWRIWGLAGATAVAGALAIGLTLHWRAQRNLPANELAEAEKLAEWQAPSDVLLETPGRALLRTTPKLGESYLQIPEKPPAKATKEE